MSSRRRSPGAPPCARTARASEAGSGRPRPGTSRGAARTGCRSARGCRASAGSRDAPRWTTFRIGLYSDAGSLIGASAEKRTVIRSANGSPSPGRGTNMRRNAPTVPYRCGTAPSTSRERRASRPPELVGVGVDHPVGAEVGRGEPRHARHPLVLAEVLARLVDEMDVPLACVALEDLGRPVLRAVVGRDDEVGAGVQVEGEPGVDDVRLVAGEERHDQLHRRASLRRRRERPVLERREALFERLDASPRRGRCRRSRRASTPRRRRAASSATPGRGNTRAARAALWTVNRAVVGAKASQRVAESRVDRERASARPRSSSSSSTTNDSKNVSTRPLGSPVEQQVVRSSARSRRSAPTRPAPSARPARPSGARSGAPRSGASPESARARRRRRCDFRLDVDVRRRAMHDLLVRVEDRRLVARVRGLRSRTVIRSAKNAPSSGRGGSGASILGRCRSARGPSRGRP